MTNSLRAELSLESRLIGKAGADRIALLEAIGETGSISAAARRIDLSYRAAWDAVQVLNNLFDGPLVLAGPGGAAGGGAALTAQGRHVVSAFRTMEASLRRMLHGFQAQMSDPATPPYPSLLWALNMKISVRNLLGGVVSRVTEGAVNA